MRQDRSGVELSRLGGVAAPCDSIVLRLGDASFTAVLFGGYAAIIQVSSMLNVKLIPQFSDA